MLDWIQCFLLILMTPEETRELSVLSEMCLAANLVWVCVLVWEHLYVICLWCLHWVCVLSLLGRYAQVILTEVICSQYDNTQLTDTDGEGGLGMRGQRRKKGGRKESRKQRWRGSWEYANRPCVHVTSKRGGMHGWGRKCKKQAKNPHKGMEWRKCCSHIGGKMLAGSEIPCFELWVTNPRFMIDRGL